MKKIFLILTLLSLGVSKAQVVGGYLPVNSTKSATMGGLRVNGNETVTGTFSVGSTATVSGVITTNSIVANSGQLRLYSGTNSDLILRAVGASQAITSEISGAPKFQVNSSGATVTGSLITTGTHSLGSANLTGGNTGTVAVLSDVPLSILNQGLSINPADGVVYYMGTIPYTWQQLQGNGRYYLDANYTLTGATINFYTNGTLGSSETVTIAIGVDNSFTNISTALTMTAISTYTNVTGLSQNINSGSYIETRITCPAWVTNPTSVGFSIVYNFRRRS